MFMKKLILAICAILMLIPTTAYAATNYTITVRAGSNNVNGTFTSDYENELISLKKNNLITNYSFSSSKVTIEVAEKSDLPTLPDSLSYVNVPSKNYYLLPISEWGYTKNQGKVSRNEEIVVQYGSLLNGIEYTVYYIERGTTRNIALPKIERVEASTGTVSADAIAVNGYTLAAGSPTKKTITLDPTISDNKIVFEYDYVGPGGTTTTTTETTYTAGDVTTTYLETEVPTYVATPIAGGGGGGAAGGGAAAEGGAGDAGEAAAEGEGEAEGGAVEIPDAGVPLAPTPNEETDDEVSIEDGKVPLAQPIEQSSNWKLWIACIAGAVVIIMGSAYLGVRRRKSKAMDFSKDITKDFSDHHKKES